MMRRIIQASIAVILLGYGGSLVAQLPDPADEDSPESPGPAAPVVPSDDHASDRAEGTGDRDESLSEGAATEGRGLDDGTSATSPLDPIPPPPANDAREDEHAARGDERAAHEDERAAREAELENERDREEAPPSDPGTLRIGELELTPHVAARARLELRSRPFVPSNNYVRRGEFTSFVESRARLGLDARWRQLRVMVQVQDARVFGAVGPGVPSGGTTGVHQGFFEIGGDLGYIRVGRQEYTLGAERFIGPLPWLAVARSFDGMRLHGNFGKFQPDVFLSWNRAQREVAPGERSEGDFLGIAAFTTTLGAHVLEPYILFRHDGPTELAPGRQRDILHFGTRANGRHGALVYDLEGAVQTGRTRTDRRAPADPAQHLAFAAIADLGWAIGTPAGLTLTLGGAYGSGASGNGRVTELDNFFPTNHLFYGYADLHGLRNTIDGRLRMLFAPEGATFRAWVDAHVLALANPGARWSDVGGNTMAFLPTNDERITGYEVDVEVRWTPIPRVSVWAGYAAYFPGPAVRALTDPAAPISNRPSHWAYVMTGVALPSGSAVP